MVGSALEVRSVTVGDLVTMEVVGELDVGSAPHLRGRLRSVCSARAWVDVDLSGVTFVDCSGLRPLTEAYADLGDRFAVVAPSPAVSRLFCLLRPRGSSSGPVPTYPARPAGGQRP